MPFVVVSVALAALALGLTPHGWLGAIPVAAAAWWWLARHGAPRRARLLVLALLPLLMLWVQLRLPQPGPADPVRLLGAEASRPAELSGRLLSDPRPNGEDGGCRVTLASAGGNTELRLAPCPPLQEGWRVAVRGVLSRPTAPAHPLLGGSAERLGRQGVWSRLKVSASPEALRVLARPAAPVAELRRRMAAALLQQNGPERGGVQAALVLGSAVVPLPVAVREAFRAAGLSHALAASGFHLTVLLGAVMALGRRLPRLPRCLLAVGAMLLFLLLAGPQPSVVRAVLMGAVAFAVLESGQRSRPLGVLLAAVLLMLLVQPAWLLDVGFQLSVAATAGLMLTARDLEQALACRVPGWAAAGVAVPLAASLWTLPLQLLHFGTVPLWAVPANLAVAPLLTPLTLGSMAAALVAVTLPPLLPLFAWPLGQLSALLLWLAQAFAALPLAQWQVGRAQPLLVALFALGLLPILVPALGRRLQGWARLLGLAAMALTMALHLAALAGDQLLVVHQWGGDLLIARHQGRAALLSSRADGLSCGSASRLAVGLGVQRFDWIQLLDPVATADRACWQGLTALVLDAGDGSASLQPGQRLESRGLQLAPLTASSAAHVLTVGRHAWLLLPDRQSLWAWQQQAAASSSMLPPDLAGLWLGFAPRQTEWRTLEAAGAERRWVSGDWPAPAAGWRASGASGFLEGAAG
jgi:competence protein ComEC